MSGENATGLKNVQANQAKQLVYNITTSENHKGYYIAP